MAVEDDDEGSARTIPSHAAFGLPRVCDGCESDFSRCWSSPVSIVWHLCAKVTQLTVSSRLCMRLYIYQLYVPSNSYYFHLLQLCVRNFTCNFFFRSLVPFSVYFYRKNFTKTSLLLFMFGPFFSHPILKTKCYW